MQPVLIVDDSLTVRMDLAEAFDAAGMPNTPCATITEARTRLSEAATSLVILDVRLPDGDGVDFLREIRAHERHSTTPVMLLSTEADVADRIRGLKTGADDYVGKPYDSGYLLSRARQLLEQRGELPHEFECAAPILVIDDSATFRAAIRDGLLRAGYSVSTASSGEEGLRMAAATPPCAILVDGVMPGIDGPTVIRRIRLDTALRGIPCVLLTAQTDSRAELHALDAGADSFVRKDEPIDVILARIGATLRRATARNDASLHVAGPKRVLIADGNIRYLDELTEALRAEGYDVAPARSGTEAVDLLAVQPVDCVLLDLNITMGGGKEICRRIKMSPTIRDTPLIMLTSGEDRAAAIESLAAGADDCVTKAGDMALIRARVRAQIRRKQMEDEHRHIREELLRFEHEAAAARAARAVAESQARLADEVMRKNRELEAFSYSVSHDLRAPLRIINGFSQVLMEDCGRELSATAREHLGRVRTAAERMGELIEDLMELGRIGSAELNRQRVDLSEIARIVAAGLQDKDGTRKVTVSITPNLIVEGDSRLLRVLLENLIGNAWKFTSKRAHARIEVGVRVENGTNVCFVRDNGAGFDMRYADRLFQPFKRLHSEHEFHGTGVGLATVARVVERHGGMVWADGAIDAGATISFTLPEPRPWPTGSAPEPG